MMSQNNPPPSLARLVTRALQSGEARIHEDSLVLGAITSGRRRSRPRRLARCRSSLRYRPARYQRLQQTLAEAIDVDAVASTAFRLPDIRCAVQKALDVHMTANGPGLVAAAREFAYALLGAGPTSRRLAIHLLQLMDELGEPLADVTDVVEIWDEIEEKRRTWCYEEGDDAC